VRDALRGRRRVHMPRRDPHSIWRSDSGRFLFLLFDPVLLHSARKEYVIEQLTNLLQDNVLVAEITGTANHRRVLQGLVTLRFRGNVDFWRWQASIGSQDVFPAIFEGLCNLDLVAGFDWLSGHINPDVSSRIVLDYLPYLINAFGFSTLRPVLLPLLPKLPDPYQVPSRDTPKTCLNESD
jgi:hypothetical protein